MNKSLRITLWIVMVTSVFIISLCTYQYISLGRRLKETKTQLNASRETWEKTASEKEALQEILKTKREELKEAELSYSEATARADELKADIDVLNREITSLRNQTGVSE